MSERLKIEEVLRRTGQYVGPTVGISMLPLLKSRRDTVVIKQKIERLKPLDVALYKRGETYVLHRVLEVLDGGYRIRGDNCYEDEYIPEKDVIGVLTEFFRKGKHVFCTDEKYLRYVHRMLKMYKPRRFFVLRYRSVRGALGKVYRKIFPKK